jgi:hypothetical protein
MTRVSTALLTIGPRLVGSYGERAWRISGSAQIVEGSTPYWITTPTQPSQYQVSPSEIEVAAPQDDCVIESILFLLASHFGGEAVENYLLETHNISLGENGTRQLARFYELVDETKYFLARNLCETLRLGVIRLDDSSLVNDGVIGALRDLGFDVEVFGQRVSAQI